MANPPQDRNRRRHARPSPGAHPRRYLGNPQYNQLTLPRRGAILTHSLTSSSVYIGALKLDDLQAVVLDMSAINEKQQGIFDIRETCASVLDLLNEPKVKERLGEETKLLVY